MRDVKSSEVCVVKGKPILLVFFALFAVASFLIPVPMFPGNIFTGLAKSWISEYLGFLSALFNGVFYGVILWFVFWAIGRKLWEED